jgi:hypothetical protein
MESLINEVKNIMIYLFNILNNTFLGTLLAGMFLAFFGFYLYRRQKRVDIKYEDLRKLRELASVLFTNIEIASKNYKEKLNIYDSKNTQLKSIIETLNAKSNDFVKNKFEQEINNIVLRINQATDNLVSQLKINDNYNEDIKIIVDKIPVLNFYLLGSSVLYLSKPEDIKEYEKAFNEVLQPIQFALQALIKQKQ